MSVCVSVCMSVYLSVFLSVQGITFEPLDIGTSFLVCRYILTISRSSLSIKVIGSRSRSYKKNDDFTYFNFLILYMWLQVINKVKITHQGQGHIKIKVKYLHPFKFYGAHTLCKRVVCIRLKCYLLNKVMPILASEALLRENKINPVKNATPSGNRFSFKLSGNSNQTVPCNLNIHQNFKLEFTLD